MESRSRSPDPRGTRAALRAVAPIALAVLAFGVTFGVLARDAGMGTLAPLVMSALTFAGSAQFAAVSVLGAGGSAAAAVAAALLLNARYGPIGLSVARDLPGGPATRFLQAQLIVDESWALASDGHGRFNRRVLIASGITIYVAWVGGTAVGVFFGNALTDPSTLGLDAAFPALFLALLWPQLTARLRTAAAVLGALVAVVLVPITPAGVPIVAAAGVCLLGLGGRPGEAASEAPVTVDGPP